MRPVFVLLTVAAALLQFLSAGRVSHAQGGLPTVTIMDAGIQELNADLEMIMNLAGPQGKKQWPEVRDLISVFAQGIDPAKPIRVDVLFGEKRDLRLSLPILNQGDLEKNIMGFVGAQKFRRIATGLYLIDGKAYKGYLRTLASNYGVIAEDRNAVPATFDPLPDIQPLLTAGFDLAAIVKNDADGAEKRRKAIQELREELLATIRKLPDETDEQLELRRVALQHQMSELERIFADSQQLTLGWTTDVEKKNARLDLELTALPGSELEQSLVQLAAEPSVFSSAARSEQSIFFGRINHALDAMRQKHLGEILDLSEKELLHQVSQTTAIQDGHRAGMKTAVERFYAMVRAGNRMGVIDGFIDVNLIDGQRSVVGAIRAADGTAAAGVLEALREAGWTVEIGTPGEGQNVAYHRMVLPESVGRTLVELFGDGGAVHVATTPDAVYYAAGPGAADRLKQAVEQTGADTEKNDGTFLEAWFRVGPWVEFLHKRRTERDRELDPARLTPTEKSAREERAKLRQTAITAMSGGQDTIHLKLQRQEQKVVGTTTFAEDILRFVGMQIVGFAADKLN